MWKKAGSDDQAPALAESSVSSAAFRKNWARLIQKIYQVVPLLCPKRQGEMRIISFIEDGRIIRRILAHLGLWETHLVRAKRSVASNHDPPLIKDVHIPC